MQRRHLKLLAIFAILFSLLLCTTLYLFVAFHYHHAWSLFCNMALFIGVLLTPAICFGYRTDDPIYILKDVAMSEETYRNWRDCGFVTAAVFFLVTFLVPLVPWFSTNGEAVPYTAVLLIYAANTFYAIAYIGFYRIFILEF